MSELKNPICVALDSPDPQRNEDLAAALAPEVGMLKIGLTAFASGGPGLVARIAQHAPVFLDLKLHDIPAQVEGAVTAISRLDVRFTTVHALGGPNMMERAVAAAGDGLTVLAVTILTSMDARAVASVGLPDDVRGSVSRLARLARDAGVPGLVCSPLEIELVRHEHGRRVEGGPLLVVPGVRNGTSAHDQKRTLPARDALEAGADALVIGRPITEAADPVVAARELIATLGTRV